MPVSEVFCTHDVTWPCPECYSRTMFDIWSFLICRKQGELFWFGWKCCVWFKRGSCLCKSHIRKQTWCSFSAADYYLLLLLHWCNGDLAGKRVFNVQSNCIRPFCSHFHLHQMMSRRLQGYSACVKMAYRASSGIFSLWKGLWKVSAAFLYAL